MRLAKSTPPSNKRRRLVEAGSYAELLKLAGGAVTIILIGVGGFMQGRQGTKAKPKNEAVEVLAASFVDSRSMREAASATDANTREVKAFREQQHDDSRALRGAIEELTVRIDRLIVAFGEGAVTPRELTNRIGTLSNRKGPE